MNRLKALVAGNFYGVIQECGRYEMVRSRFMGLCISHSKVLLNLEDTVQFVDRLREQKISWRQFLHHHQVRTL